MGVIVWIIIIFAVVLSNAKKKGNTGKTTYQAPPTPTPTPVVAKVEPPTPAQVERILNPNPHRERPPRIREPRIKSQGLQSNLVSSSVGNLICDDRENDWLAQEIRYEQRAMYSEASILRQEHFGNCDAEKVRDQHAQNCDAKEVQEMYRN